MCTDGHGSSGQTGHTHTGGQFKLTYANEDVRFVCPKCGNSFAYKGSMEEHMDNMHNNIYKVAVPNKTHPLIRTGVTGSKTN